MGLLDDRGLTDGPGEITRAIGLLSSDWATRPLLIAGFDDMTRQQFELVRRMAVDIGGEVTVALSHEAGNPALDMTNGLMSELVELKSATPFRETTTTRGDRDDAGT